MVTAKETDVGLALVNQATATVVPVALLAWVKTAEEFPVKLLSPL